MGRIIIGIIVGFIGAHSLAAEKALVNGTVVESSIAIVLVNLVRSFITSIIAGYMTALVAGEYKKSTMVLGIILVLVGVAVEYMFWDVAPAWYHILFVLFLLPMTIVGGKLRRSN